MVESNKVSVRIYGQEYTISGVKSRDYIMKVADRVDTMMKEISESMGGGSMSSLAVLAAVNITDEMFSLQDAQAEKDVEKDQLNKDVAHYMQLWDEAKKNFLQYKEDAQAVAAQKDKLQEKLNQKAIEHDTLIKAAAEREQRIEELENRVKSLTQRLKAGEEGRVVTSEQIRELEDKYKEIEGSYFELQMENIQLKGDLERYRKLSE
ncbi:MAG: cell division protein ZapA [Clostridiales Family XIII bacterium]|jgi:cell division protein ZapA (FtsZ GTPase activity inhibitor)|nr:cell division protein ZapA [Clostridiales Family XIII bacterium]